MEKSIKNTTGRKSKILTNRSCHLYVNGLSWMALCVRYTNSFPRFTIHLGWFPTQVVAHNYICTIFGEEFPG